MKNCIVISALLFLCQQTVIAETYRISYINNTPQTFTSAVCISHSNRFSLFSLGTTASKGLANLAQDGAEGGFVGEVKRKAGVDKVKVGEFVGSKESTTLQITGKRNSKISCILGMLVVTNDGFVAFRSINLPKKINQKINFKAQVYDAGSEVNTESCSDVPGGACGSHFVGVAEKGTIQKHIGIIGGADLSPSVYGWKEPAAVGVITRIK